MNDTERRGELDADQNVKVLQKTGEAAPGGFVPHVADSAHGGGGDKTPEQHGGGGAVPNSSASPTAVPAHH